MKNYPPNTVVPADPIGQAFYAELKSEPKQWFIMRENHRGGLKLGIGMFDPGITLVAQMCYHGEPSVATRTHARLIVAAVNSCYAVNPQRPDCAAEAYTDIVKACKLVVGLEISDVRHDPIVCELVRLVRSAMNKAQGNS